MHNSVTALLISLCVATASNAVDYHNNSTEAWKASTLNASAIALYGKEKFSTIKQTLNMELITPKALVDDAQQIPVRIRSNIPAKSISIFFDGNDKPLVAVFYKDNFEKIDFEIHIKAERKGTLFAVIESMNGILYYKRAFIEVLCLPCMAK